MLKLTDPRLCMWLAAVLLSACTTPVQIALAPQRGAVRSVQVVTRFTRDAIDAENGLMQLTGRARCDVSIVQLTYDSIGVRHEPAVLSAALYVPENCTGPFPLLAEAQGTQTDRRRLTSEVTAGNSSIIFFAAQGYLMVAPDYLGLGKSSYPYHPYLHAESEASAMIDAIRAARRAASALSLPVSDKVMLFGYSQGGHAAMAAQREIERHHRAEIQLAASAPMAGPYHLSQTFLGSWFGQTAGEDNYFASELVAYAIVSYSKIYPDVCREATACFAPPYVNAATTLFPGTHSLWEIRERNLLPPGGQLNELRNPTFTSSFLLNEHQPFRAALKQNDLLDWTPATPMLLCGSHRDTLVDFNNARAAQASFRSRGVEVPVIDIASEVPATASGAEHHMQYGALCYAAAKRELFDPIRQAATKRGGD